MLVGAVSRVVHERLQESGDYGQGDPEGIAQTRAGEAAATSPISETAAAVQYSSLLAADPDRPNYVANS